MVNPCKSSGMAKLEVEGKCRNKEKQEKPCKFFNCGVSWVPLISRVSLGSDAARAFDERGAASWLMS